MHDDHDVVTSKSVVGHPTMTKHNASRVGALYIFFVQQFVPSLAFVLNRRWAYPAAVCELSLASSNNIVIQQINQDSKDDSQLEEYSKFCINMFHNCEEESGSIVSRKWKDIKLAMLQKAQMIDLSVPFNGNRSVFIARARLNSSDNDNLSEIIGCCEVIEERIVISQEQNKSPRIRPIIENLAVDETYRRRGVGKALLEAVEENVQAWIPFHDDIFAQVEADNLNAKEFFIGNNFEVVFIDRDCKKDDIEGIAFSQTTITKLMLKKSLDT